jgi:hypothetical protein
MNTMRPLLNALLVMAVLVATGSGLAILLR